MSDFLTKWDSQTPEAKKQRILTALELLEAERPDPKSLEQKRQRFVNEVTSTHEAQKHQSAKALSDKEIRQWDELTSKQGLNPEERMRLNELRQRASQELAKALGASGMKKGAFPLLVNSEVRKSYERLSKDEKAMQKIEALTLRLQIGKSAEQSKEAPLPFTHEMLQKLLLNKASAIKEVLQKSGDYRFWVIPMNNIKYAEEQLIPTITPANNDLDGTLRLTQSFMDIRPQFACSSDNIPRVGVLRELAGILPKEAGAKENSGLPETELSQKKTESSKHLDEFKDILKRSGDNRFWILPNQVIDTARTLLGEIRIGGDNPSEHGMIQARLNTVEAINKYYRETYSPK